jgi:hypothetical protein
MLRQRSVASPNRKSTATFEDIENKGTPHDALQSDPLPSLTFRASCISIQRAVAQLRVAVGCLQQRHLELPLAASAAPGTSCWGCCRSPRPGVIARMQD